ncbi:MAG: hypothetical protein M3457_13590, partial [Chloroflexota bacterium]|nr:hypothetical protein [Chloroflexota bacterium]
LAIGIDEFAEGRSLRIRHGSPLVPCQGPVITIAVAPPEAPRLACVNDSRWPSREKGPTRTAIRSRFGYRRSIHYYGS